MITTMSLAIQVVIVLVIIFLIMISIPATSVSSIRSISCVRPFATPWTAACQASLSIINSSVQSFSRVRLFATPWITARRASVHHQLPEFTQTHVHWVGDAIQPSHPLLSPSPPVPNPSQHQSLFPWVNSSHELAKVLEFQLQHQSFQWTPRADLL